MKSSVSTLILNRALTTAGCDGKFGRMEHLTIITLQYGVQKVWRWKIICTSPLIITKKITNFAELIKKLTRKWTF